MSFIIYTRIARTRWTKKVGRIRFWWRDGFLRIFKVAF